MPTSAKERPILFSAPMIRSILDNRKTQTRRIIKTRGPAKNLDKWTERVRALESPYGRIGDRLWLREAWRVGAWREDGRVAIDYRASPEIVRTPWVYPDADAFENLWIQSTEDCERSNLTPDAHGFYAWEPGSAPTRWRPSIFMPRWASRITLEITDVRVQRLQDISEEDARAEGFRASENVPVDPNGFPMEHESTARDEFRHLWDSINAKKYPWPSNPWVWAISFRRVEQ